LPFIEPELREGRDEIELALKGMLPELVTDKDVRGILHTRADASDGTASLESMATSMLERGFEYFGAADHSTSAFRFRRGEHPRTVQAGAEGALASGRARFRLHGEHQSRRALNSELDHMHCGPRDGAKGQPIGGPRL
jgi:hypothetical protein